jgi:hypothetical protein
VAVAEQVAHVVAAAAIATPREAAPATVAGIAGIGKEKPKVRTNRPSM